MNEYAQTQVNLMSGHVHMFNHCLRRWHLSRKQTYKQVDAENIHMSILMIPDHS